METRPLPFSAPANSDGRNQLEIGQTQPVDQSNDLDNIFEEWAHHMEWFNPYLGFWVSRPSRPRSTIAINLTSDTLGCCGFSLGFGPSTHGSSIAH